MPFSGAPDLVDRCLPFTQEVKGLTPNSSSCLSNFSHPVDQDIGTQCALSWKIVVSEWQSVIAVSLKVDSGACLIKPAKLYMCTQKHYKHQEDGRTGPGMCNHGSILLSHSGNVKWLYMYMILPENPRKNLKTLEGWRLRIRHNLVTINTP